MKTHLRILHLEDNPRDAELVRALLEADGLGCDIQRVETRAAFEAALARQPFDLILSDYTLPSFDGSTALAIARQHLTDASFLFVSGTIGEEVAVDSLKEGAVDYVLKDRLQRLVPAVHRAMADTAKRAELKRAEEAMRQSEFKYRQLFESLSDAAFVTAEATGRILDTNRQAELLLGRTRGEIVGQNLVSFHPAEKADPCRRWLVANRESHPAPNYEVEVVRPDGGLVPVSITAAPITLYETRLILALYRDITETKRIEAQFLRAQRLESIGALTSGIAHDLNNILAPILMAATMLRYRFNPDEVEKTVATIESSAKRGAELVKQLLLFGRGVEGKRAVLQLRLLVNEILKMVKETFPKAIEVKANVAADLWAVVADASQLYQVLLNLCVNARDAMPGGGTLEISAQNVTLDEQYASMTPGAKAGPYVRVEVADTGTGIAPDVLDKIFDPFFTTKEAGKGTGLGLSTVLGILKGHGGFVDLHSQVGQGTTFYVFLPAEPGKAAPAPKLAARAVAGGQGELILVVDDEPQIGVITRRNLEKNGYRVLVAPDGVSALVTFTQRQNEVKVLLTDLEMPLMDGVTLVRAVRQINPRLPVIVATGIGDAAGLEEKTAALQELGVQTILNKPFAATTLLEALQRALPEESGRPTQV